MIKAETLWTGGRTNVCEMNDKVDLPGSFGNVIKIDEIYEHISIHLAQAGETFMSWTTVLWSLRIPF